MRGGDIVAEVALTADDGRRGMAAAPAVRFGPGRSAEGIVLRVDHETAYQEIDGFGASLNGSSVWLLRNRLDAERRAALLRSFFHPTEGIGLNLLRQPIGGSDQNAPGQPATYDDNDGRPDPALDHFSIRYDLDSGIVATIREAMRLNPRLRVLGTVWRVPGWMLTGTGRDRALDPAYDDAFARYLARYIRAYEEQGVPIWALTPQNEPLYSYAAFGNNLTAERQNALIKRHIGPLFAREGIRTKILIYDHNWDHPEYPALILGDAETAPYVAGTAWHYYAGDAAAQSALHERFPDKGAYFTEASPPAFNAREWGAALADWSGAEAIFDALRNWSRTYIQWTLLADTAFGPGECRHCGADAYVDEATGEVTYSVSYYLLGHLSAYVQVGARRVASDDLGRGGPRSVAFRNPDGSIALLLYNGTPAALHVGVEWAGRHCACALPSRSLATLRWRP